jgi:diguanylate cyclase (GGDEF)-like protein
MMSSEDRSESTPAIPDDVWRQLSVRADDLIVMVDGTGTCVWSSADGAGLVGRVLQDAFHPDDAVLVSSLLSQEAAGPAWLRLHTDPQEVRWLSAIGVPRTDSQGWVLQLRAPSHRDPLTLGSADVSGLDETTGMVGRERALNEVAWLLSATPRTGKEIAVACCGLDGFAVVNEQLGREVGDEVLRVLSGRISDALRSGDLVARLDGDRLLIVLRGVHHLRGAIRVANKVRAVVEDPIPLPGGDLVQTVSIGVTLISRGESVDSVLNRAEGAMSMAKESGRNLVMSSPPI